MRTGGTRWRAARNKPRGRLAVETRGGYEVRVVGRVRRKGKPGRGVMLESGRGVMLKPGRCLMLMMVETGTG
eukprot:g3014.t1